MGIIPVSYTHLDVYKRQATDISTKAKACYLYYGTGYDGKFIKTIMYDDGAHNDEKASDGIFGAAIPGQPAGTYIRYYVEAIADNGFNTASYLPEGAVHDVFILSLIHISL